MLKCPINKYEKGHCICFCWMMVMMIMTKRLRTLLCDIDYRSIYARFYSSKVDLRKLRPMILKRIERRAKDYPIPAMVPVAQEVLQARDLLIQGVSVLLKVFCVTACKFCPEVYIGEKGHLIQTCHGYRHRGKNRVHEWIYGGINDILVPVETFHLNMFQDVIKHQQRFDFPRIPAVVELCYQAGAEIQDKKTVCPSTASFNLTQNDNFEPEALSNSDLHTIASGTLTAWEIVRSGVKKLLMAYPAKVCKHCSEVHVGQSGHKARLCGVFKYESWRGSHFWKKADVDDLVPPKIVWYRRPQDPPVLVDQGREFYGHAPAIVALCVQAGAIAPAKYNCMMKVQGLPSPTK
ncbi:hypothetical protein SAY86_021452 [Trapa natans]|uniref:APO domain-containing protein n=1 Tax=Trapa natans TaxID=22666 RepID=A0AAN7MSF7_TRANT|nr:hypothetical protein SAY86_021452 [Trapa natans]